MEETSWACIALGEAGGEESRSLTSCSISKGRERTDFGICLVAFEDFGVDASSITRLTVFMTFLFLLFSTL